MTEMQRFVVSPRTLVFVTRPGQVLLVQGAPGRRRWAGLFNAPGGHIERGEDPLSGAMRELEEESGLVVPDLWLCGVFVQDDGDIEAMVLVYRGEYHGGELGGSSEGEPRWVGLEEWEHLPLVDDLYQLLPRALAARREETPFSALIERGDNGTRVVFH